MNSNESRPFVVTVDYWMGYNEELPTLEIALTYATSEAHKYCQSELFEGITCENTDTGEVWGLTQREDGSFFFAQLLEPKAVQS